MAVDVSKIPNNSKFDPVREAILDLEQEISSGVAGVSSVNNQTGAVTIAQGSNVSITTNNGVITISSTASGGGTIDGALTLAAGGGIGLSSPSVFDGSTDLTVTITNTDRPNDGQLNIITGAGITTATGETWLQKDINYSIDTDTWASEAGASFSANAIDDANITIEHGNTSDVPDVINIGGNVLQSMSFDQFGHVQSTTSRNLDERYLIWRSIYTSNDNRTATASAYNDMIEFKGAGSIAVTKSPTNDEIRFGLAVSDIRFEDGKRVARGFLYWQSNTVPTAADVPSNSTFSFDSYLITINDSNWSEIPPTTGYSLTTYYIVRYTSIDDGAGTTASRAVTYGVPEDSTGFEGPVTFNSLSEELGSNGFTIIDGGRVKTGRIQSIGLNTSDLDQGLSVYTNQGSFFDLGSGDIVTMDFSVISGEGNFKGSLKVGQGVGNVPSEINKDGTINLANGVFVVDASGNVTISNAANILELDTLTTTVNGINDQVDLNSSNISTNSSNITIANGNIATNASNIATLQSDLNLAEGSIAANATNIQNNATNITANANSISVNSSSISSLSSRLTTAEGNISSNASNIQTNATNITANGNDIAVNASSISALQVSLNDTNNNVSANASNISTNTANISSNASGISANASSISSLTATVNGNTSSITTNANAIAEANGYTEANYALTADANGIITGIQLKAAGSSGSTGQVSDITMKTNTFNIVDQNDNVKLNLNASGDLTVTGDLSAGDLQIRSGVLELRQTLATSAEVSFIKSDSTSLGRIVGTQNSIDIECNNVEFYPLATGNTVNLGRSTDRYQRVELKAYDTIRLGIGSSQTSFTDTDYINITSSGTFISGGLLVSGTKNFYIDHPQNEGEKLVHSAIESPEVNNLYRGEVELVDGKAQINLDTHFKMTEGTFVLFNRKPNVFTTNESDWDNVRGKVEGNILSIECQNTNSTANVSWMIITQRCDDNIMNSKHTDENGELIVETKAKPEF